MKATYDKVSDKVSKITTNTYSTSFSIGIRVFKKRFHSPIYAIYGFVRLADEVVDSFHGYDKERLLMELKRDTYKAIDEGISLNPILNSFQEVVNKYNIDHELIEQFLKSMEMDLENQEYDREKFEEYILGSAEVVGLMCLKVFIDGDEEKYEELKPYAMKLGAAFQKINFLRDLKADHQKLGRSYFPNIDLSNFTEDDKKIIEEEIAEDFREALKGIRLLPKSVRFGVYIAYVYYIQLFKKIRKSTPGVLLKQRVRVPNSEKYSLLFSSFLRNQLNLF